jgi:hypothetical protein
MDGPTTNICHSPLESLSDVADGAARDPLRVTGWRSIDAFIVHLTSLVGIRGGCEFSVRCDFDENDWSFLSKMSCSKRESPPWRKSMMSFAADWSDLKTFRQVCREPSARELTLMRSRCAILMLHEHSRHFRNAKREGEPSRDQSPRERTTFQPQESNIPTACRCLCCATNESAISIPPA